MLATPPEVKHTYQNHTLDSTRWQRYGPRDDDRYRHLHLLEVRHHVDAVHRQASNFWN